MYTDYKFKSIKRDNKNLITEAVVDFYEGDFQTIKSQQVYVRLGKIRSKVFTPKEFQGDQTDTSFSRIQTDQELRRIVNIDLSNDLTRTPIDEQKISK